MKLTTILFGKSGAPEELAKLRTAVDDWDREYLALSKRIDALSATSAKAREAFLAAPSEATFDAYVEARKTADAAKTCWSEVGPPVHGLRRDALCETPASRAIIQRSLEAAHKSLLAKVDELETAAKREAETLGIEFSGSSAANALKARAARVKDAVANCENWSEDQHRWPLQAILNEL